MDVPHDWGLATDCPAWTVHDVVAHLIGAERWTMGEPLPDYELPDLPHVGKDFERWTEVPVQLRKGLPPAVLVAETYSRWARNALRSPSRSNSRTRNRCCCRQPTTISATIATKPMKPPNNIELPRSREAAHSVGQIQGGPGCRPRLLDCPLM